VGLQTFFISGMISQALGFDAEWRKEVVMGYGETTVAEAGAKGGASTSKEKVESSRLNGQKPKRKRRIETLIDKK
jgi:hypothetical protein